MPRVSAPELVSGARGPRGPENVTMVAEPTDFRPKVRESAPEGAAHFVSRYREYDVLLVSEPDRLTQDGKKVPGRNRHIRFKDWNLITTDAVVIRGIRDLATYGLNKDVWEKYQQDEALARRSLAAAEAAIDALPEERRVEFITKLTSRYKTFPLPVSKTATATVPAPAPEATSDGEELAVE